MNAVRSEYIGDLSPSQKAWQTAKDRAVHEYEQRHLENQRRGEAERQEMIRALTDPNLSHGAARLFCLLVKAGWIKGMGGLYMDRVGSILCHGRRLARMCGGASVNLLYRKRREAKIDPVTGAVLRSASETEGWIEQLVRGGYIWISKHRIPNIPKAKWPNVYNVACHVPQQITPSLPWTDGNFGSESVVVESCSPLENSDFVALDQAGDGESAENPTGKHRNGTHPVTGTGDRLLGHGMIANHRNGGQAVTGTANGQAPERHTGKHRNGGRASTGTANGQAPDPVQLRETLDSRNSLDVKGEGSGPHRAGEKAIKLRPLDSHLPGLIKEQIDLLKRTPITDPNLPAYYLRLRDLEGFKHGAPVTKPGAFHQPKPEAAVQHAPKPPSPDKIKKLCEEARRAIEDTPAVNTTQIRKVSKALKFQRKQKATV